MKKDKNKVTIKILSSIIIFLLLLMIFFFIIKPKINQYANEKRYEGIEYYVLNVIIPQLQANGYVQIPIGNETLVLIPYIPEQSESVITG